MPPSFRRPDSLVLHLSTGSAISMAVRVLGLAIAFLSHVILSRALGTVQYGSYVIALSWAMVLVIPARLGLDNSALRFATVYRARSQDGHLCGLIIFSLSVMVLLSALIGGILIGAKLLGFGPLRSIGLPLLLGVVCLVFPLAVLGWLSTLIRTANRIFESQFFEQILRPVLLIAAIIPLSVNRKIDASTAMLLTAATVAIATFGLGWRSIREFRQIRSTRGSFEDRRLWLSVGWLLFLAAVVQELLNQVDLILLGIMADATQAAHFAAAWRLASLVPFGLMAIATVSGPLIALAHDRGDRMEFARIARLNARFAMAFAVVTALVLAVVGRQALGLFGPGFEQGYTALLILLVGGLVNAFTGVVGYYLILTGQQRAALYILLGALVLSVSLNVALIPAFGAIGSAIASVAGLSFWNVAMTIFVRRQFGIDASALGLAPLSRK